MHALGLLKNYTLLKHYQNWIRSLVNKIVLFILLPGFTLIGKFNIFGGLWITFSAITLLCRHATYLHKNSERVLLVVSADMAEDICVWDEIDGVGGCRGNLGKIQFWRCGSQGCKEGKKLETTMLLASVSDPWGNNQFSDTRQYKSKQTRKSFPYVFSLICFLYNFLLYELY